MSVRWVTRGHRREFLTLVAGRSQVAVMKPSSGDWTVLTRRADQRLGRDREGVELGHHANVLAQVRGDLLFGRGSSWGGYESLAIPVPLRSVRSWGSAAPLSVKHPGARTPGRVRHLSATIRSRCGWRAL